MYLNGVTQNILSTFGKTIDPNFKGTDNNAGGIFDNAYQATILRASLLSSSLTSAGLSNKSENPGWNDIGVCIQPKPDKCPAPANTDPKLAPLSNFLTDPDGVNYDIEESKSKSKTGTPSPELQTQINNINNGINTLPANNNEVWSKINESTFMDLALNQTYSPTGFITGFTTQKGADDAAKLEYPDEAAYKVKIDGGGKQLPDSLLDQSLNGREVIYNSGTQFKVTGKNETDGLIYLSPINQEKPC